MTEEQIQEYIDKIDNMTQIEMARLWRFSTTGSPYFVSGSPIYEHFILKFEGFTPEISKAIGW